MAKRQIVKIDEEKCNGCGQCVSPCVEGAITIEDGKARVKREELCDGAGFCIGVCPQGALTVETREAAAFNEQAVEEQVKQNPGSYIPQVCFNCGNTEEEVFLLPGRNKGQSLWVCTKCLPTLIHG
ncbi:Ferredoxin-3 [Sporotomaculum syntrophicum]|uniref:Ferredoxin-3 n=1 Tax=Sporotomaculum syntrophicum TaxID=182264 RepID=A0A9D3AZ92_9FIRM|nr:4Fe-4S binding protein [Sporotomaculum syntrophicum]KAF1085588.1 Ferredoxin-3 [Sporotomaculum syntrophicum]